MSGHYDNRLGWHWDSNHRWLKYGLKLDGVVEVGEVIKHGDSISWSVFGESKHESPNLLSAMTDCEAEALDKLNRAYKKKELLRENKAKGDGLEEPKTDVPGLEWSDGDDGNKYIVVDGMKVAYCTRNILYRLWQGGIISYENRGVIEEDVMEATKHALIALVKKISCKKKEMEYRIGYCQRPSGGIGGVGEPGIDYSCADNSSTVGIKL